MPEMLLPLVTDLEGVTPEWLTRVLRKSGSLDGTATISSISAEPVGAGQVGALYRLSLIGQGDPPATVMAKVGSPDAAAREFAKSAGLYLREIRFYDELASELAIRAPEAYYAGVAESGTEFLLLFEDLAPALEVDQLVGCSPDQAALALEQAARLHGQSWESPAFFERDWLRGGAEMWLGAGTQVDGMQAVFRQRFDGKLEDEYLDLAGRLAGNIGAWLELLKRPRCLWHGDFRLDNVLFDAKGGTVPIAVFDWQTITLGPPGLDVSYFLGSALTEGDRRAHEDSLLRGYHSTLVAGGVANYTWEECWLDYRAHSICGFLAALIGAARAAQSERGDRMLAGMARRHGRQVLDLDAFAALEAR